eukprot:2775526-Rhodomonas_salina.1
MEQRVCVCMGCSKEFKTKEPIVTCLLSRAVLQYLLSPLVSRMTGSLPRNALGHFMEWSHSVQSHNLAASLPARESHAGASGELTP